MPEPAERGAVESPTQAPPHDPIYDQLHETAEFQELRRRFRRFAFPATVAFLAWYLLYVVLSVYAHDFMARPLFGNVSVGLAFGLLQFVSTFVLTHMYVSHANRRTDPIADEMRDRLEHHEYAAGRRGDGGAEGASRV
jgi:uncharacterized membrane protein (DUF485 family)